MENNANRWMATALLLAMFGIIAYAGTRSTTRQTVQNVLVTNTSSQPIPVAARPSTGAYIVSVANAPSVKVANGPDSTSADLVYAVTMPADHNTEIDEPPLPNSTAVVIDSVGMESIGAAGEYVDYVEVAVYDGASQLVASPTFIAQAAGRDTNRSAFASNFRVFVPKNGHVFLYPQRAGGISGSEVVSYTLSYHTVAM